MQVAITLLKELVDFLLLSDFESFPNRICRYRPTMLTDTNILSYNYNYNSQKSRVWREPHLYYFPYNTKYSA